MPFLSIACTKYLHATTSVNDRLVSRRRPSGEAELLEHEGLIPLLPAFLHPAALHPVNDEAVDRDWLARRRRRTQRPRMCPSCAPPERYPVPLYELIFDREVNIGECAQQPRHPLLERTDPAKGFCHTGDVEHAVVREHVVRRGDVAAIQAL